MTRKEHISNLETIGCDGWTVTTEAYKSLQWAIQSLSQEPCRDAVSREAAIEKMADYVASGYADSAEDFEEYSRIICQLPSVTQKPIECDDAISREELLKAIDTWDKFGYTETGCFIREPKGDYVPYIHYDDVIKCIKGMPPVTPKQKTGKWEWVQYDYNPKLGNWNCSECRSVVIECVGKEEKGGIPLYKYCPQCGAKMQESEDKE